MSSAKSLLVLLGVGVIGLNTVAACSSTGDLVGFGEEPDAAPRASLPESGAQGSDAGIVPPEHDGGGTPIDSSVPPLGDAAIDGPGYDAGIDAAADAAPDAPGTDAGATGSPCPTQDQVGKQTCGLCGFQTRLCGRTDPADPASPLAWQEWGFCQSEVVGGCVPGTATTEACGLCGTRAKVCQNDCQYAVSACKNEPVGACQPGTIEYQAGLSCAEGGRSRTCAPTCEYGAFGACFVPGEPTLTLATNAGGKVSGQFTLEAATTAPRLSGTCPTGSISNSATSYSYVLLVNPTASTLVVSLWTGQSTTAGSAYIDTVLATYASSTKPATDAERKACTTGVNDTCSDNSDPTACVSSWAGLFGASAITIPPNGKAYAYVGAWTSSGHGDYQLTARTDAVN